MESAQPQHQGVLDRAVGKHGEVGRSATDIDEAHPEVAFVIRQRRFCRGERLEYDVDDVESRLVRTLHDVLRTS